MANITSRETLTSVMANIQAIFCCTALCIEQLEGYTPNRAKYYQGVKFYQPEIVSNPPENDEYHGVKNYVRSHLVNAIK